MYFTFITMLSNCTVEHSHLNLPSRLEWAKSGMGMWYGTKKTLILRYTVQYSYSFKLSL
jgi:hypothetical protein